MHMLRMLSQEVLSVWYDPTYFNGQVSHTPLPSVSTKKPTQKTLCFSLKWFRCKVPRFSPFLSHPLRISQTFRIFQNTPRRSDHRKPLISGHVPLHRAQALPEGTPPCTLPRVDVAAAAAAS